ncbi:MAG TPA: hypothetical protein VF668_08830 [Pyrinomonadaceae bacterium]|jgi:hypothetical protein
MRNRVLLAALLLASLFCVGFARQAREGVGERWEYKAACGRVDLNRLGEEGWELAAATQDGNVSCLYFKRRK